MPSEEKDEHIAWESELEQCDSVHQSTLTNEFILSYRHAAIWIVMCRIQKVAKHIVTLFFYLCTSASVHHFYHI